MQLGGHRQLAGFGNIIVIGIFIELGHALAVLNGDRASEVVELHDLLIAVVIGEGVLVASIADAQRTAGSTAVIFLYLYNTVRLTGIGNVIVVL